MRAQIAIAALVAAIASADAKEYRPNDVRPWQSYIEAKQALKTSGLRDPSEAPPFMIGRLGPLPWRFEPDAETPFKTVAVVQRMYVRIEGQTRRGETVARVEITYPDNRDGLQSEDEVLAVQFRNVSPSHDGSKCTYPLSPYGDC